MNIKGKTIKDISIISTELAGDSCMLVFDDNTTLRIDPLEGRRLFFWPNAEVRHAEGVASTDLLDSTTYSIDEFGVPLEITIKNGIKTTRTDREGLLRRRPTRPIRLFLSKLVFWANRRLIKIGYQLRNRWYAGIQPDPLCAEEREALLLKDARLRQLAQIQHP